MAISVFDLFKIGIGPSSSHTVGPMRAAATFAQALRERGLLAQVQRVEVRLYGSLSATGVGHATDRACLLGLMGQWPDQIDPHSIEPRIAQLLQERCLMLDGCQPVDFDYGRDMLLLDESLAYHPNAMTLNAEGEQGCLFSQTYYSVGGGFIVEQAEIDAPQSSAEQVNLPYEFSSAAELLSLCKQHGVSVSQLMMANERAWRSEDDIRAGLLKIWAAMRECVANGMRNDGILPVG